MLNNSNRHTKKIIHIDYKVKYRSSKFNVLDATDRNCTTHISSIIKETF